MPLARIDRRILLIAGAAAATTAWPVRVMAQAKVLRVGYVGLQPRNSPRYKVFLKRMAELGYQEGQNLVFEYIQTPSIDGYFAAYRELAERKVDVFLAVGNEPALLAARTAAEGKPIVFLSVDFDPLAKGYVASLQRPGGNITGIFVRQIELAAKRVEIVRELFPQAGAVAIAFDLASREQRDAAVSAAHQFGLTPRPFEITDDYTRAFTFERTEPVVLPASPSFARDGEAIGRLLLERRLPAVAAFRENTQAGAVVSYGFDLSGLFRDIAGHVAQIGRGARPSDLPIEQSQRFHLAVNLKAAQTLGITLPDAFIARANEVIE
ncbi:MAG: ABC transporter substrate-binding protein [Hyphomicrobiales bacterium]|nr:ABC transporter substrate-binding protein [Hyphomicrobiales bacterium]